MGAADLRGALHNHLSRLLSGRLYTGMREGSKHILNGLPGARRFLGRWEEHVKGMFMPGTLFEELGFNYIGPVDGHDVPVPHFGVVLERPAWDSLAARLQAAGVTFLIEPHVRFRGLAGEQATLFFLDPSGNALEFKSFNDIDAGLFAT